MEKSRLNKAKAKALRPPFPQVKKDSKKPIQHQFLLAKSDISVHRGNITQAEIKQLFGTPPVMYKMKIIPESFLRQRQPPPPLIQEGPTSKKLKLAITPPTSDNKSVEIKRNSWIRKGLPTKNPQKSDGNSSIVVKKEDITIFKKRENEGDEYIKWLKAQSPSPQRDQEEDLAADKPDSNFLMDKICDVTTDTSYLTGDDNSKKTCDDFIETCDDNNDTCGDNCQTDPSPSSDSCYWRLCPPIAVLIPTLFSIMLVFKLGRK